MPGPVQGGMSSSSIKVEQSSAFSSDVNRIRIAAEGGSGLFIDTNRKRKSRAQILGVWDSVDVSGRKKRKITQKLGSLVGCVKGRGQSPSSASYGESQDYSINTVHVSRERIFSDLIVARSKLRNISRKGNFKFGGFEKYKIFMEEGFERGFGSGFRLGIEGGLESRLSPSLEVMSIKDVKSSIKRRSPQAAFYSGYRYGFKRGFNAGAKEELRFVPPFRKAV
ncbi:MULTISPECIES: hypothetical protein [Candidatus Ichthyocystis]|uniref:Uncharacterized protein n=1 Tax=Candidatus Ichthyocystis hellenicum TaxID=1561003 RepID=A0A0S4M9P6_9BURK|nr:MULTISPECIES: hypothetical protein [Ichthyocystis]CUT18196.1 hypothetical protein Ark11_1395 [Candidatus Ichthyocystis hellenicum]